MSRRTQKNVLLGTRWCALVCVLIQSYTDHLERRRYVLTSRLTAKNLRPGGLSGTISKRVGYPFVFGWTVAKAGLQWRTLSAAQPDSAGRNHLKLLG